MLELLQRKKFGPHKIPDGWILTAAGNPEEYNKSVNELDMVTLDRVKKIVVEPDYDAFKTYAYNNGIHDSVISFLSLNNQYLFKAERSVIVSPLAFLRTGVFPSKESASSITKLISLILLLVR